MTILSPLDYSTECDPLSVVVGINIPRDEKECGNIPCKAVVVPRSKRRYISFSKLQGKKEESCLKCVESLLRQPISGYYLSVSEDKPLAYTAALCYWTANTALSYGSWFIFCLALDHFPSLLGERSKSLCCSLQLSRWKAYQQTDVLATILASLRTYAPSTSSAH